jgi:hypothetical protein
MCGVILSLGLIHRFTPASSLVRSCISFLIAYPNCWIVLEASFANIRIASHAIRVLCYSFRVWARGEVGSVIVVLKGVASKLTFSVNF